MCAKNIIPQLPISFASPELKDPSRQKLWQLFKSWTLDKERDQSANSEKEMLLFYEDLLALLDQVFDPVPETHDKPENEAFSNPPSPYFEQLITALKILVDPEMIFVFEIPLDDNSEIKCRKEVYMVIKHQEPSKMEAIQGLLTFLLCNKQEVCIHPITIGYLNKELKDGNIFFLTHITQTNLIYKKADAIELQECNIQHYPQILSHAKTVIENGWATADLFLKHAEMENKNGNQGLSLFFIHQSIELRLRALVLAWERHEKKTHEIRIMIRSCLKFIPDLAKVFPQNSEEECRILKLLEDAYCKTRYKSCFPVNQEEANELLQRALQIKSLCVAHYQMYFERILIES
ncbi:hypothetical protein A33Q_1575 [Indibacter alkaliphilus LW1]|uniref:HEPN domain-containing protein n=1 Tax=Indibacter alkaliphilus (strain CCUG 57479 / KCTC 22604 / LW1) TaxID=1189612 RepID=S2E6M7_INDAL|nr:HEPN domain-containing protein [Indibacter alkaliphilus]EOZ97923.1 hypothetical protein A33Q_1575 [Indibacter alkaliphilus LW1]